MLSCDVTLVEDSAMRFLEIDSNYMYFAVWLIM